MDFEAILAAEERRERRLPRWVAIARAVRRGRALWDVEAERHRALVVMEPVARDPGERGARSSSSRGALGPRGAARATASGSRPQPDRRIAGVGQYRSLA